MHAYLVCIIDFPDTGRQDRADWSLPSLALSTLFVQFFRDGKLNEKACVSSFLDHPFCTIQQDSSRIGHEEVLV